MFKLFVQRMVLGRPDDTKQYSRALLGLAVQQSIVANDNSMLMECL